MSSLHLLGTGAALSDPSRTTTMLAFDLDTHLIVVDCGGDVVQRLLAAGLDLDRISLLILTHEHPDHVSGFPLFMEKIWLAQRRRPIPVRGPARALDQARKVFGIFNTSGWKGLPEIEWGEVELQEGATVWEDDSVLVTSAPGKHSVPVIGVRVEDRGGGGTVTYSCDTERTPSIERLAQGSDLLVHEATGGFSGHTSPRSAGEVAAAAGVGRLVLVHLGPKHLDRALAEARGAFANTDLGEDGARYAF